MLFFTFFRRTFRKLTRLAKYREYLQTALTLIAVLDNMLSIVTGDSPYVSQFIRIVHLIVFIRSLREALKRIALVIWDSKEILLVVIAFIFLFGWVGFRLFRGTQQGEAYFSSLSEGIWSMMVLLTTANFPDVMMVAYNINPAYAIFFVSYLIIVLFFLLNLVLAVYYNNYRTRVENTINKFMSIREQFLRSKFESHDRGGKGFLSQNEFESMITELFALNLVGVKRSNLHKIAAQFTHRFGGQITLENFLNYFEIMDFVSLDSQIPKKIEVLSPRRMKVKSIITHPYYDLVVSTVMAINISSIIIKDMLELFAVSNKTAFIWIVYQLIVTWLFLLEMIFICYGFGVVKAFKRRNHIKVEAIFQIIIMSSLIYLLIENSREFILRSIEIISIVRGFRLLKLFNEIKQWKIIMRTISSLMKPFSSLLLVAFILFLFFALIGDRLFGGLRREDPNVVRNQNIPDGYVDMNFNDVSNSFVTLFTLMVVNNWYIIVEMFESVTGSVWTRFFFIFFYFLSVLVLLNILVALSIDMYSSIESVSRQDKERSTEYSDYENDTLGSVLNGRKSRGKYVTTPLSRGHQSSVSDYYSAKESDLSQEHSGSFQTSHESSVHSEM